MQQNVYSVQAAIVSHSVLESASLQGTAADLVSVVSLKSECYRMCVFHWK